jgi:hypothetical protein
MTLTVNLTTVSFKIAGTIFYIIFLLMILSLATRVGYKASLRLAS